MLEYNEFINISLLSAYLIIWYWSKIEIKHVHLRKIHRKLITEILYILVMNWPHLRDTKQKIGLHAGRHVTTETFS
jgi:hypothetical protein